MALTSITMAVQSRLLALPDELLDLVLDTCLYEDGEFSTTTNWSDLSHRYSPLRERRSWFSNNVLRTSKRLRQAGLGSLWKYVVVDSAAVVKDLLQHAKHGVDGLEGQHLGVHTLRMDVRIRDDHDPNMLAELLGFMHQLKIFTLGCNHVEPHSLTSILESLNTHCTSLARLEFWSSHELPTMESVRGVVADLKSLRTLHVSNVPLHHPIDSAIVNTSNFSSSNLTTLSLGYDHWAVERPDQLKTLNVLGAALASPPRFPNLQTLHFRSSFPSMRQLCTAYGPQIRELLCVTPNVLPRPMADDHLLHFCPNARHFVWVLLDSRHLGPAVSLPERHDHLESVSVVYGRIHLRITPGVMTILDAADVLHSHQFPSLRSVSFLRRLDNRGACSSLEGANWFEEMCDEFREIGIDVGEGAWI
ncbi:hypothetical protein NMY22_g4058 [Coprinellus aureogranulatus]|nr:hypothetical protein NMY22_g4058 [Coprinellus aureogranulatus]